MPSLRSPLAVRSPLRPGHDHIDVVTSAPGAHQPLAPVWNRHLSTVPLRLLSRVGLDLVAAVPAPHYEADAGSG